MPSSWPGSRSCWPPIKIPARVRPAGPPAPPPRPARFPAGPGPGTVALLAAFAWLGWLVTAFASRTWSPAGFRTSITQALAGPYDWSGAEATWRLHGAAIAAAALLWAAAWGWGWGIAPWARLGGPFGRAVGTALGLAALGLALLGAGVLGLVHRPALLLLAVAPLAGCRRLPRRRGPAPPPPGAAGHIATAATALLGALYAVAALAPELGWDALTYHVHVPARYVAVGRIHVLPHSLGSFYPFLAEQWFMFASAFGGDGGARLVNWGFLPAIVGLLAALGARAGAPGAGRIAGLLFAAQPAVASLASQGYNDLETAFFGLAAVGAALEAGAGWRLAAGALCGAAFGCKYTGLWAAVPCGALWLLAGARGRRDRAAGVAAVRAALGPTLLALAVFAPWPARDWLWTGNPVFPLLGGRFPDAGWNPFYTAAQAGSIVPGAPPTGLGALALDLLRFPGDFSLRFQALASYFTPLLFGFLPLALWPGNGVPRRGGQLAGAGLAFCALYVAFRGSDSRYLLPGVALLALPAALGAARFARGPLTALAAGAAVAVAVACQSAAWTSYVSTMYVPWRVALGAEARRTYLNRALLPNFEYYLMAERVNATVPRGSRLLVFSDILGHYYDRATIFDTQQITPPIGFRLAASCRAPAALRKRFRQLGVDRIVYSSRTIAFERSCHCLVMDPAARACWTAFWRRYAEPGEEAGSLRLYRLRGEAEAGRLPPAPFLDLPGIQDPAFSVAEEERTAGRFPAAEAPLRRLAAEEPGLASVHYKLAELYLLQQQGPAAAREAATARRLGLDTGALRLLEAGVASAQQQHARALAAAREGVARWPAPRPYALYAALAWNARQPEEARAAAREAVRLNPFDPEVRRVVAVVH